MDWEITVQYGNTKFTLQAEKVYESNQIMRIKVYGKKGYILLENDYPFIQQSGSKKAVKWKIREGEIADNAEPQDAKLIAEIISELDNLIKGKHNRISYNGKW